MHDNKFLERGGEMGELTRSFNWHDTKLGNPETWPQSLKTTLSIILNSSFPMFLFWGPDLVCFYNDAYRPSLGNNGKHPSILGMPAAEAWPEIWYIIKPLIDQVLAGGEATWSEDQLIPIYRNGKIEDVYWTFSYSPVSDESGNPAGVFVTCTETTGKVLAYQQLEENNRQLALAVEAEMLAQKKIRENERNLRLVIMQAPVAIAIFRGADYVVEIVNPLALELWGRKSQEVLNMPILDVMQELKEQGIKSLLDHVYETGEPFSATELPVQLLRGKQLETVYINFVYEALYGSDGKINGLITIGTDVTQQVLARKKIEESESRFRAMVKHAPVAIAVIRGSDLTFELINDEMLNLLGKPSSIIGKPYASVLPEMHSQPYLKRLEEVYTSGIAHRENEAFALLEHDGKLTEGYYNYIYQPVKGDDGVTIAIMAVAVDVTMQVKARQRERELNEQLTSMNNELNSTNEELIQTNEEIYQSQENLLRVNDTLAESEARFRSIVRQAPVAMSILEKRNLIVATVNDMMLKLWGKTDWIVGLPLAMALPELAGQPFLQILDDVYTSGKAYYGTEAKVAVEHNGELKDAYFNFVYYPLKDNNGAIDSIMVVANDVTEQVLTRHDIQEAEEHLRMATLAAELGTFDMDLEKGTLDWDSRCRLLFGISHNDPVTYEKDFLQGLHPDDRERINNIISDAFVKQISNGDYDVEYRTVGAEDKKIRWIRAKGKVIFNDDDKPARFIGSVLEITNQKENELRKNDFIGMVSHELKTPLTSLKGYVQMLHIKAKKQEDDFAINALGKVETQVNKMSAMINGFLNVTRLESGKIYLNEQEFKLDNLVQEVIEETTLTSGSHNIALVPCDSVTVYADMDKIEHVISNLLSNAVKYSPRGTPITVKCEVMGDEVQVSVSDEGVGIKPNDIEKLFERYYRVETSDSKHISGFGIGLYLSAEIVQRHNGKIWVESEFGKGSTFYFTLPVVAAKQ